MNTLTLLHTTTQRQQEEVFTHPVQYFKKQITASTVLTNGQQTTDLNSFYNAASYLDTYKGTDEDSMYHADIYQREVHSLYSEWKTSQDEERLSTAGGFARAWKSLHTFAQEHSFPHKNHTTPLVTNDLVCVSLQYLFLIDILESIVTKDSFEMSRDVLKSALQKTTPISHEEAVSAQQGFEHLEYSIQRVEPFQIKLRHDLQILHAAISITHNLETDNTVCNARKAIEKNSPAFAQQYDRAVMHLKQTIYALYSLASSGGTSPEERAQVKRELLNWESSHVSKQAPEKGESQHVHFTFEQK